MYDNGISHGSTSGPSIDSDPGEPTAHQAQNPIAEQERARAAIERRAVAMPERAAIGPYQVVEAIGKGGMGQVYRARDTVLDRDVAVKLISRRALQGNEDALVRFLAEAKLTARICNRHVVEVHALGTDCDGSPYLVMELLHGRTLRRALQDREPFPLARIVSIGDQILTALVAAHEHVVHRDLKPPNIFLTRDEDGKDFVKVLDFGIAKALSDATADLTGQGMIVGTPLYTAPEVVLGPNDRRDRRQDLYGVGVMLFEMATGTAPWPWTDALPIYRALHAGKKPRRIREAAPEIDPAFAQVVDKAMAMRAEDRYQSAAEFRAALRSVSLAGAGGRSAERPAEPLLLGAGAQCAAQATPDPQPKRPSTVPPLAAADEGSTTLIRERLRRIGAIAPKIGQPAAVEISGGRVWSGRAGSTEYAAHRLRGR
jgi:serine/threonine-protein kinase